MDPDQTRNTPSFLSSAIIIAKSRGSQKLGDYIPASVNLGKRKADAGPVKSIRKRFAFDNLTNNFISSTLDVEESGERPLIENSTENTTGIVPKSSKLNLLRIINLKKASLGVQLRNNIATDTTACSKTILNVNASLGIPLSGLLIVTTEDPSKKIQHELSVQMKIHEYQKTMQNINEEEAIENTKRNNLKLSTSRISHEIMKSQQSFSIFGNPGCSKYLENKSETDEKLELIPDSEIFNQLPPPSGVTDFDEQNSNDPFQVSHYAYEIFAYLKKRESEFIIDDYMSRQKSLTKWMRSFLIDWMVEVQESFELNHETLYLGVKLVDIYLSKVIVEKDKLQVLGAGGLFIACKYHEKRSALIEDFSYIGDGAYNSQELIQMEIKILKLVDFKLGIPLSYEFLRRYARCAKILMPTLTLARYILEKSLMDYETISLSDSKLACATLFIAIKMVSTNSKNLLWNRTLEYYTGYKLNEFAYIIVILNTGLHRKPKNSIKTIREKYSHRIFYEVAKIPLLTTQKLFENTGIIDSANIINSKKKITNM